MPNNSFQLNFDEMATIAKSFKDEGEDMARLHAETRQRVRDLYKEWVGEGAEKFFEEMEAKLLPALHRLSLALFHTQDISNDIMKIIQGADEETVGYFKDQLSGDDFGAGKFDEALDGVQGGQRADDFGAGKFGQAVSSTDASSQDLGTGQSHDASSSQGGGQDNSQHDQKKPKDTTPTDKPATTSSGGGGGSSSQGLKGDLKNMGVGLGEVLPQNAESGIGESGAPANMPDHVYSSGSDSPNPSGAGPQPGSGTGSGDASPSVPEGVTAGAVGVAGVAAAGGAAKAVKGKKKKSGE